MSTMSVEDAIRSYIKLRDHKSAIESATKAKVDEINKVLRKLEALVMDAAKTSGVNSFKSEHGTAFLQEVTTVSVKDWDAVLSHVKGTDSYELLTKGVNKSVVTEFVETNREPPPGVGFGKRVSVKFRKASS